MTKKTVTIDLTFKKWMKFALLAVFFFILSFGLMTCARAQSGGTAGYASSGTVILSCCGTGSCCCSNCITTYPQPYQQASMPPKEDPAIDTFRRVWFAGFSVIFGLISVVMVGAAIGTWDENG